MISIVTEKARVPGSSSDFAKQMYADVSNDAAESWANDLRAGDLPRQACTQHPNHTSTVAIIATGNDQLIRVEKRNFCCPAFEQQIKVSVQR